MCFATGLRTLVSVADEVGTNQYTYLGPGIKVTGRIACTPGISSTLATSYNESCVALQISAPRDTKRAVHLRPKHAHEYLLVRVL